MVVIFSTWWFFFKKFTVISPLTTTPKMSLTHPAVDNSQLYLLEPTLTHPPQMAGSTRSLLNGQVKHSHSKLTRSST